MEKHHSPRKANVSESVADDDEVHITRRNVVATGTRAEQNAPGCPYPVKESLNVD
jgi:hypothetical protein